MCAIAMANPGSSPVQSVLVGLFVVAGAVGGRLALDQFRHRQPSGASIAAGIQVPAAQQDRFGRIIDEEMGPLLRDPRFQQELERRIGPRGTQEQARALGQQLTARGIGRLPLEGLDGMNRLRSILATNSEPVCVGLWTGNPPQSAVASALASLPDDDLRLWMRLSTQAARMELGSPTPAVPDTDALRNGLQQIQALVPEADRETFAATMAAGTSATPAQGCSAMRAILALTPRLEPALRERFLRAFAAM